MGQTRPHGLGPVKTKHASAKPITFDIVGRVGYSNLTGADKSKGGTNGIRRRKYHKLRTESMEG